MKYAISLTILLLVSGCASHTGVVALGNGSYMIAKQQATGFPGLGNMKAEIISEAAMHCASLGKQMRLLDAKETQPPYILGNYPRSEIQFTCVAPNSTCRIPDDCIDSKRHPLFMAREAMAEFVAGLKASRKDAT